LFGQLFWSFLYSLASGSLAARDRTQEFGSIVMALQGRRIGFDRFVFCFPSCPYTVIGFLHLSINTFQIILFCCEFLNKIRRVNIRPKGENSPNLEPILRSWVVQRQRCKNLLRNEQLGAFLEVIFPT
jgi:hypothetical protein